MKLIKNVLPADALILNSSYPVLCRGLINLNFYETDHFLSTM